MGLAVLFVSLVLLMSLVFGVSNAIRTLKEGPMIDAEGREYKTVDLGKYSPPEHNDRTTVRVQCTEVSMIVFIQADFYSNGRLVSPQELFLGDAKNWKKKECQAVDAGNGEYVIEADLHDCGSKLMVSADNLIYSNNLILSPPVGSYGITRASEAVVPVACHYKRTHTVSSIVHQQPLTSSTSLKFPLGSSPFSLKLKTADWLSENYSNTIYLGDSLHLEASYTGPDQRKLFIDLCVATLTPDFMSAPRYCFIENNGCFVDARDGGLNSVFQPRITPSSLQFQFDAFLFQKDLRNTVFVTCEVKATHQLWKSSPSNKVCNYINSSLRTMHVDPSRECPGNEPHLPKSKELLEQHSGWKNVDGSDGICQCCKGVCHKQSSKDDICDTLTLGPFVVIPRK